MQECTVIWFFVDTVMLFGFCSWASRGLRKIELRCCTDTYFHTNISLFSVSNFWINNNNTRFRVWVQICLFLVHLHFCILFRLASHMWITRIIKTIVYETQQLHIPYFGEENAEIVSWPTLVVYWVETGREKIEFT